MSTNKEISDLFKQTPHPKDISDYYHCFNSSNILNVIYWWKFFEMVRNIPGDIIECGVGRGRSLLTIMSLNNYLNKTFQSSSPRKIFALDSFEGFPEPTIYDLSPRNPKKGEWSTSPNNQFNYSIHEISKILFLAQLNPTDCDQLVFVKGFFDITTPSLNVNKVALLHLDGDLYESILIPLDNLWSKVAIGGIIVIDDFLIEEPKDELEGFPGARKAVYQFLKINDCFELKESIRGTPFLLRIK